MKRSVALWFGAFGGPAAWLTDLQLRYALEQYVCLNHAEWIMWLVTIASLALAVVAALVPLAVWRRSLRPPAPAAGAATQTRVRFMSLSAAGISAMFALSIIAMAVPDLFLGACD